IPYFVLCIIGGCAGLSSPTRRSSDLAHDWNFYGSAGWSRWSAALVELASYPNLQEARIKIIRSINVGWHKRSASTRCVNLSAQYRNSQCALLVDAQSYPPYGCRDRLVAHEWDFYGSAGWWRWGAALVELASYPNLREARIKIIRFINVGWHKRSASTRCVNLSAEYRNS